MEAGGFTQEQSYRISQCSEHAHREKKYLVFGSNDKTVSPNKC